MKTLHLSIVLILGIVLSSSVLLQHANASDGNKSGVVENLGFTAFSFPHRDDFAPLKQFKAGVPTYEIACNDLKLVIKKSDNTPVCVKPQNVQSLLVRGWGTLLSPYDHQTSNASSILRLDLSVTNDTIKPRQSITMEISLVNTLSKTVTIPEANDWPNNYLAISECSSNYPIGISILKGYYTKQNMTGITPLSLYSGYGCSTNPSLMPRYTFQPLSSKTKPVCEFTVACPQLMVMKSQLSYDGYYDNNQLHPFDIGVYTIVGGDEWGHIAIQHFVVVNGIQETPEKISGFENDIGMVSLKNQTYYFDTPNYTETSYVHPMQITFHNVNFTLFPPGFRGGLPLGGCPGQYYWADVKFADGTAELLHIYAGSQSCADSVPIMLSSHIIPQAGLAFSDGKMRLLVRDENQAGKDIVLQKPSSMEKPFPHCNPNPPLEKLIREKQQVLTDALLAEEKKYGGFENRTQNLPWSFIGYDCVDNALEVGILPQYFNSDFLPKYFEKIRSIVGNTIDIVLSPEDYAVPV